ncbi:Serine/threonine protein kinase [Nannocystis exedens]|uniref:Serine/threonine protein kinase n=1 Tax=Nannocystis exedens TaxID=54 RepID=A0A1I2CIK8_9BACT|nr:serine/threonine-protein kinase [Nannocystis exedens]PCC68276.1 tetratricopeptide repeat protein [Nannocystis exedens]SFE67992.1 Serine/threonine protein kinase [Nannocystis exedens]
MSEAQAVVDRSPKARIGNVFADEFKILQHLSRGDVADTFLAEFIDPPTQVWIKICRAEFSQDRAQAERLLREARAAAAVLHTNVLEVLDADIAPEGDVYVVTEAFEGEDLGLLLRRTGRLPWPRVRGIALQIAEGLQAAHAAGVVHRAIKPGNVLLGEGDHVKVADFGMVAVEEVTQDRDAGTVVLGDAVHFIAPEQALGEAVDQRSDIYSLGVLMYTLLSGRVPFFGRPTQVTMQHKFAAAAALGSVAPEAEIPPLVEALVLKAMSKRREDRFQDMGALVAALQQIGEDGAREGGGGAKAAARKQQPTTDSAMFYSLEALQTALGQTQDPRAQIDILHKMQKALTQLAGGAGGKEGQAWQQWIAQGLDYAYYNLAAQHLGAEQWQELVQTYREHAELTTDRAMKTGLYGAMGYVLDKSLGDIPGAIAAYRKMIQLDPTSQDAVLALARLYERAQQWDAAVQTLDHFLSLCADPVARTEELTHVGKLLHEKLLASERAEIYLRGALEHTPGHVPALTLLADMYRGRKDWRELAAVCEALLTFATSYYERVEFGIEAGFLHYRQLGDIAKATEIFARVIELDPENVRVGTVLSKIYYEAGNYVGAAPIYEMLVRKAPGAPISLKAHVELCLRAARVERLLGRSQRALKLFKKALDLEPGNWTAMLGRADLTFEAGEWEAAFGYYEQLLAASAKEKTDKVAAAIHVRLAEVCKRRGQTQKAPGYLRQALELDANNWQALEATLEHQLAAEDWQGALNTRRAMINASGDDNVKFELFVASGKLFRDRLRDPQKAVIAFQRALELRPRELGVLHLLLDTFTERKMWQEAVGVLDRIVDVEPDPARRARFHYTAAVLLRDNLAQVDAALARFDRVLDEDPSQLKAFQAIDKLLTQRKEWKGLDRAYRKMINRLPPDGETPLRTMLWSNLAEIYRTRLGDFRAATKAFEVAAALDPGNADRWQILVELYEALIRNNNAREFTDPLVRAHFTLLRLEPHRYASYHRLFEIYVARRELDKAFCVARTLVFVKQANAQETTFYNRYPQPEFRRIKQRLGEDLLRRCVFHADEDAGVGAVLGLLAPVLAGWRPKMLPYPLRPSDRIDPEDDGSLVSKLFVYVTSVYGYPQPDLYFRPDEPGDVAVLNVERGGSVRPTIIALGGALAEKSENNLAFTLGRHALDLYPPHYAFMVIDRSPENLKDVLMASMHVCKVGAPELSAGAQALAREVTKHLPAAAIERLTAALQRLVKSGEVDVKRWARAAELASYRAGFLFCNDLATAAHAIGQEQRVFGSILAPKEALRELVVYSVSEEYFEARRGLGLNVA